MKTAFDWLFRFLGYLGAVSILLVVALTVIDVVVREIGWNLGLSWVADLCKVLFLLFSLLGASITSYHDEQISVTVFRNRIPVVARFAVQIVVKLATLLTLAILVIGSWMMRSFRVPLGSLPFSRGDSYLIFSAGFALVILAEILSISLVTKQIRGGLRKWTQRR